MAYNICGCGGEEVRHWLFLGLSVKSFSFSLNSLQEGGSLTVDLIEDTDSACPDKPKLKLNNRLEVEDHLGPDPGFLGDSMELIGRAVMFKHGNIEFSGIISSAQYSETSAGRTYTVVVSSPSSFLDNTQVIINQYNGNVSVVPNLINAYGFLEYREDCSEFGNSGNYGNGMPWNNLKSAISVLASCENPSLFLGIYLQGNRLKGFPGTNDGYGIIPEDDTGYVLDIREMPAAPTYYKIDGFSVSLREILDRVSSDAAGEYYVELIPTLYNGIIYKIIKIRFIDRSANGTPNAVAQFINGYNGECSFTAKNIGDEYKDDPRNRYVIGPPKDQMYWVEQNTGIPYVETTAFFWLSDGKVDKDTGQMVGSLEEFDIYLEDLSEEEISPYWGLDRDGNVIESYRYDWLTPYELANGEDETTDYLREAGYGSVTYFYANASQLQTQVGSFSPDYILVEVPELIAALQGKQVWESYISMRKTHSYQVRSLANSLFNRRLGGWHPAIMRNFQAALFLRNHALSNITGNQSTTVQDSLTDSIYQFINTYATQYYGRQFMVRIPVVCSRKDPETFTVRYSREIAEGGWNEEDNAEFTNLIGLDTTASYIDFFRLPDGRIRPYCRFDNTRKLDIRGLSSENYGYTNFGLGSLWVKCNVQTEFVFGDYENKEDPRAVILLDTPISLFTDAYGPMSKLGNAFGSPAYKTRLDVVLSLQNTMRSVSSTGNHPVSYVMPSAATIALRNNDENYGPWYDNSAIANGFTELLNDSSLVPWNFGNLANLNAYAQGVASFGIVDMYKNESGSVTVPDLPKGRIGEEILAYDGSGYISGQRDYDTRSMYTISIDGVTALYVPMVVTVWDGSYGPIITGISVSFNDSGVSTTYNFSLYSKGYRRFSKARLDKNKEIGQLRQEMLNRIQKL